MKGIVPPVEYIDQLMRHLGKQYYATLQSAAVLHGATHQRPQEFTVITNSGNLRDKTKEDVKNQLPNLPMNSNKKAQITKN